MDAPGDTPQALRPVVDGVHRRHHGEENLRSADVARCPIPANVLLARLQGEADGGTALRVARDADDAPRELALVFVPRGHERGVGAAVAERYAETLAVADHHVGAELRRGRDSRSAATTTSTPASLARLQRSS